MAFLRKWQVPHPMETIKVEHSREIWSKTTAWAGERHYQCPSPLEGSEEACTDGKGV